MCKPISSFLKERGIIYVCKFSKWLTTLNPKTWLKKKSLPSEKCKQTNKMKIGFSLKRVLSTVLAFVVFWSILPTTPVLACYDYIEITKIDAATKLPLANAKFQVYYLDSSNNYHAIGNVFTSGPDGKARSDNLSNTGLDYWVKEVAVPTGYILDTSFHHVAFVSDGHGDYKGAITLSNILKIDVPVTKVWVDNSNAYRARPTSITVELLQNNASMNPVRTAILSGSTNSWSQTFTDLPKTDIDGKIFNYTVKEITAVLNYTTTYSTDKLTVTNTYVPGSLEVTKSVVFSSVVGPLTIPDFSISIKGPSYPDGNTKVFKYPGDLTQTWTNLIPGDYTITEAAAGTTWTQTVPGSAVTVVSGGTAKATVTNTYVPGSLEVTKNVVFGSVVGPLTTPDFSITIQGPSYPDGNTKVFKYPGELTQTWTNLIPGDYTITEASSGTTWTQTVPAIAVTVAAGGTAKATVTNTFVPGSLEVTKNVVFGSVVGAPTTPDFSITIQGPSYPDGSTKVFKYPGELTQIWTNLIPGDYTITEAAAGTTWTQTVPAEAVTVAAGETAKASVSNTYVPGALQVTKSIVLGDVVGTPTIPDFSITITGPSYPTGNTKVFNTANGLMQVWTNLIPGDYTITEASSGTTWTQTLPASAVTVAAGETATASIINTYVPGSLQVTKSIVLGAVVGTPTIPDFSITITGPSYPTGNTKIFNTANGLTQTWTNLIPGAYTIAETGAGATWTETVPAGAVTVVSGKTAVESVTNTYVPGALQVTKSIVLVDVVGTPLIPDFSITITGPSYPTGNTKVFNKANGLTQTWINLIPGAYTITEASAGTLWTETVPASAIPVVAGATAAATVTNTQTGVLGAVRDPSSTPTLTPTPTTGILGAAKTGESDNLMLVGGVSLILLAGILIIVRRKWTELDK